MAKKQIFLSGHGGWKPADGYVQVPKNCRVHFYTYFAKNLMTDMEYQILRGEYTAIDRTIEEHSKCPNMRLYPQEQGWTVRAKDELKKRHDDNCLVFSMPEELPDRSTPYKKGVRLRWVFDFFERWLVHEGGAEFHWMACQTLQLKQVGGRAHGLNAEDFAHHLNTPGRYRIHIAGNVISWC